jgi:hypothetical protein
MYDDHVLFFFGLAVVMLLDLERTLREREGTPPVICQRVTSTFLQPGSAHASSTSWLVRCLSQKPEGPSNDGWPAVGRGLRKVNVFELELGGACSRCFFFFVGRRKPEGDDDLFLLSISCCPTSRGVTVAKRQKSVGHWHQCGSRPIDVAGIFDNL